MLIFDEACCLGEIEMYSTANFFASPCQEAILVGLSLCARKRKKFNGATSKHKKLYYNNNSCHKRKVNKFSNNPEEIEQLIGGAELKTSFEKKKKPRDVGQSGAGKSRDSDWTSCTDLNALSTCSI